MSSQEEKEIRYKIYQKEQDKKQTIKELKILRDRLLEIQGMQHLEKQQKTKKLHK